MKAKTKAKLKRGRPTLDTPERRAKILEAIRGGNYRETAARYAGIGTQTLGDWMAKDPEFSGMVQAAEEFAEIKAVALVMKAAETDAKHAQWWLERKHPHRWGRTDRHMHSGPNGGPVVLDVKSLSDAELEKLVNGS